MEAPIIYALFGNTGFNIGALACLVLYFWAFGTGVQLTDEEKKYNGAIKAASNTIDKHHGLTSTLVCMCNSKDRTKLAKKNTYKQLLVSHCRAKCYICLNGDQATSNNAFGLTPEITLPCKKNNFLDMFLFLFRFSIQCK